MELQFLVKELFLVKEQFLVKKHIRQICSFQDFKFFM